MTELNDRVALVTGGGRGIGRSIAVTFAEHGARVAVAARSVDELEQVVGQIKRQGGTAMAISADLADPSAPVEMIRQVKQQWGPVEILVNNAGVGSSANLRPFVEFDDDFWNETLAVNLTAPYRLCKQVVPDMLSKGWGRIIMTASVNSKIGSLHGVAYAASKHGLLGLMRTLAIEVSGNGVTVNAICPGPVRTRMNDIRVAYDAQRQGISVSELEKKITPIGRRLETDEIAPLALYLASDEGAAMTGQAVNIDGGILMSG